MTVTDTRAFGPYQIVRRLGVGGMAETFLALRCGPHGVEQRVCLKRVLPAFAADPSFLRQFEREASIASTLRYTGIVGVVEFGDVQGAKYLALELVDGVDLRDFLAARPGQRLDPSLVARLAVDLAYSLRYAHDPSRAVVHRDVSPANVMLSRTGEVKLTDFGVARVMSSAAPTTSTGVRGKIAYMCPEHLRGEELDGRADLFALGVLLYECLCGQRPFHGAHDVEIMRRIAVGERLHVRARAPQGTPPALLAAIEGLLATERDARTPDATTLIEQLSRLPGLHQARRRLAAEVDALRGGVSTREHVSEEREEGSDTSLCPVPADALRDARGQSSARPLRAEPVRLGGTAPATLSAPSGAAGAAVTAVTAVTGRASARPAAQALNTRAQAGLALGAAVVLALGAAFMALFVPSRALPALGRTAAPLTRTATSTAEQDELRGARSAPPVLPPAAPAPERPAPVAAPPVTAPPVAADPGAPDVPALAERTDPAPPHDALPAASADAADVRHGSLRVTVIPWGDVWVDGRYMGRAPTEVSLRPGRHVVAAGTDHPSARRAVQVTPGQLRRVELELQP